MEAKEIERTILTSYRKELFRPFTKACDEYHLLEDGDNICVCISGGKDSLTLAKLMQEIERHGKKKITCHFLVMDPGYSKESIESIKQNCIQMGIPIKVINSDIFECVKKSGHKMPCYICAKMRRGFLYDHAKEMGCNKIALGHHFNDVVETTMLSILYGGTFNTMPPILDSENFEGMKLIRPLYLVHEEDIIRFMNKIEIIPSVCKCPLKKEDSKRLEIKSLIKKLKETNPFVEYNIFSSSENVELDHMRGYYHNKEHFDNVEKH